MEIDPAEFRQRVISFSLTFGLTLLCFSFLLVYTVKLWRAQSWVTAHGGFGAAV